MNFLSEITKYVMPVLLLIFAVILTKSDKNIADSFIKGVKDGAECCFNLLPTLLLIMCGISAMFSSGAVDLLCGIFRPLLLLFGVPEDMLPAIILRPISGSGVTAIADKMFARLGSDSDVTKITCLLMGSTDTIIYTLNVYFSAAKIKRTRYALPASFVVFVFSIFVCVAVGKMML